MSKYNDYDDYEEYEEEKENKTNLIPILDLISTWFIRIGLVLATITLIYYVATGKFLSFLLYILGLVCAYFFGYFFMLILDRLSSNN